MGEIGDLAEKCNVCVEWPKYTMVPIACHFCDSDEHPQGLYVPYLDDWGIRGQIYYCSKHEINASLSILFELVSKLMCPCMPDYETVYQTSRGSGHAWNIRISSITGKPAVLFYNNSSLVWHTYDQIKNLNPEGTLLRLISRADFPENYPLDLKEIFERDLD